MTHRLHGLFGGAFDPIHRGHLHAARTATAAVAAVTFVPTFAPPHRPPPRADFKHRLAMTRLAVAGDDNFAADDIERTLPTPSFTIATLTALRRRHPDRRYALIVGADALLKFKEWHRWRELFADTHIVAVARGESPSPSPLWWRSATAASVDELHDADGGKLFFVNAEPMTASSTKVRARIAGDGNLAGDGDLTDLPPTVADYIKQHKLYGAQKTT